MSGEGSKRCRRCGEFLPLHQFFSDRNAKDGLTATCKRCAAEKQGKAYFGKRNKDIVVPEGYKRCTHCERVLLKEAFGKCVSKKDGLQSWCNECRQARRDQHRKPKEAIPEGMKRCYKCKQLLPATTEYFSVAKHLRDGLQPACKQCFKAYRLQNRERILQQKKEHYYENVVSINAGKIKYYYAKQEALRNGDEEILRQHRARLAESAKIGHAQRRTRKLNLPYDWSRRAWKLCLAYWDNRCSVCGGTQHLHADHWIPLSSPECPGTVTENMIVLCRTCNVRKHTTMPEIWLIETLGEEAAQRKLAEIQAYFARVRELNKGVS
ncbi:MAG: HNH endonuclease [Anaerolinea sp.]|nr:HNH endonuclease [Anaerolinea sp.]